MPIDKLFEDLEQAINSQPTSPVHTFITQHTSSHEIMLFDQIQLRRVHEDDFNIFASLSEQSGLFLDIGASIGTSLLSIHFVCPKWRIVSFEPNRGNYDLLDQAIDLVRKEGGDCQIFHFGLSDKDAKTTLYVPKIDNWFVIGEAGVDLDHFDNPVVKRRLSSYSSHGKWELTPIGIDLKVFDEISQNITKPNENIVVVKIDVEGHELNVLSGMKSFIRKVRPIFLIENDGTNAIAEFLKEFGYKRFVYFDGKLVKVEQSYSLNNFYLADNTLVNFMN